MIGRIQGVLCCGNISYDIPVWPVDEVAWGKSLWVDQITFSVGGNGSSTSYSLATMGGQVRLTGMVGRDREGEAILEILKRAGVDLDIRHSDQPTTSTVVLVQSSGDRSFLHRPGASRDVTAEMLSFHVPGYSHFHLANLFSLPTIRLAGGEVMRRAKAAGLTTSLDTAWDAKAKWMEDVGPCLPNTDLLFVNDSEAKMLTGSDDPWEATRILRSHGAKDVILKVGPRGCIVFEGNEMTAVSGYRVQAKDTTGAGDCFAGGFLASLQRGLSYLEAAKVANAVGASNVENLGSAQGARSWEDTQTWMRERDTL
ncbi:MAG TPA: carbohydrate kinase family protein [Bryobacteraceae bacterium]|nr:carbohydrate kinase family protein [Bryobacteraceae bacterium]